ncbi:hypothetical protein AZZ62_003993, partial [Klebsiella variicola]
IYPAPTQRSREVIPSSRVTRVNVSPAQISMMITNPRLMPARTRMLRRKPCAVTLLSARILFGPGVRAVIRV